MRPTAALLTQASLWDCCREGMSDSLTFPTLGMICSVDAAYVNNTSMHNTPAPHCPWQLAHNSVLWLLCDTAKIVVLCLVILASNLSFLSVQASEEASVQACLMICTQGDITLEFTWVDASGKVHKSSRDSPEGHGLAGGVGLIGIITVSNRKWLEGYGCAMGGSGREV